MELITVKGKYSEIKILQNKEYVEESCIEQLKKLADSSTTENQNVVVMADCHTGKGSCIGYTQTIRDKVIPSVVGVDIGCGIYAYKLKHNFIKPELEKLDKVIRQNIPLGKKNRHEKHEFADKIASSLKTLIADVNYDKELLSVGTCGGGNHFIEIDVDSNGDQWLVIHSGSRHLGLTVAEHWQRYAVNHNPVSLMIKEKIDELKKKGQLQMIQIEIDKIKKEFNDAIEPNLAYLEGESTQCYLHDMKIAQEFAHLNRDAMAYTILDKMNNKCIDKIMSVHNYIDLDNMILRKGATSLQKDERAIIPINMSYGSLIVTGLGNKDFNCSGPHGAGRLMSRTKARESLKMKDYKQSMKDVYTTSVSVATIDEAPMAYKPVKAILDNIKEVCNVADIIHSMYNLKATD